MSSDMSPFSYDWGQTEEDVYIDLIIGGGVKKKEVNLQLVGKECTCKLKDGRLWKCTLLHEVHESSSKVTLKDGALRIQLQKKEKFQEWASLEEVVMKEGDSATDNSTDGGMDVGNSAGTESQVENHDGNREGDRDCVSGDNVSTGQDETMEKEYVIEHAKYDFFPNRDMKALYLYVYVKKIKRSSLKVNFAEEEISIKFQTNDNQFLQLNPNSTADTLFCWKIKPWKPIIPSGCSYKVTNSNLEVFVKKQTPEKWQALERSTKVTTGNRTRVGSQGDWVSLSSTKPTSPEDTKEIAKDVGSEKETMRGAVGGAKSVEIKENSVRTKKPTCTVPPLSLGKQTQPPPVAPAPPLYQGFCGLDNLGNTCFMNSVLQVLANTRELKDFMLEADFSNEINRDNPLGTGGHLVLSFAVLMRRLWGGQYKSIAPSKLKSIISGKASQFMGFAQHDAQEFMAFLLDGLHEDINRIRKKPYTETIDSDGRADEVVAEEAWKTHKRRNDSFIVDMFQGQYKSKLVCPECDKVSITFDPFMHLSVPLPKKKRRIAIFFYSRDCHRRPVKYVLSLSSDATVHDLTVEVGRKTGVHPANLRVFEVYRSRVHKHFSRRSTLSGVSSNDVIFVCEVLSPSMAGETVVELTVIQRMLMPPVLQRCSHCKRSCEKGGILKRCTKCYRAAYCDQACQKSNWSDHRATCRRVPEPVGSPFMISLPQSHATYSRLCQIMESYARYSANIFMPPLKSPTSPTSPTHSTGGDNMSSSISSPATPLAGSPPGNPPHHRLSSGESSPATPDGEVPHKRDQDTSQELLGENAPTSAIEGGEGTDSKCDKVNNRTDDDACINAGVDVVTMENSKNSEMEEKQGTGDGQHAATVVGQPQVQERKMPKFFIKPVNNIGNNLQNRDCLKDEGDQPLDLQGLTCLAMDWRNDPKQENHVLLESKHLDYVEDESVAEGVCDDLEITLDQCLRLFTEPEKLSPEEAWYCPRCKHHREATKQLMLWKLPSTLIIQLKRFSFGNSLWRDKINRMVDYPVHGLDLSPFCHGNQGSPQVYDLYGVINHHGGILGGHYTSYCRLASQGDWSKNEHEWRLFDDSHVTPTSEKNVVTRSAYLLFYRRRQAYSPYIPPVPREPEPEAEDGEDNEEEEAMDEKASSSGSEMEVVEGDTNTDHTQPPSSPFNDAQAMPATAPPGDVQFLDNRFASSQGAFPQPDHTRAPCEADERGDIGYTDMEDID
ncbi:ubiquitin carboxyl-terminal hydrolase 19-like [Diadema antillarum]|uniref:ubiquitin carboxyl-terminal hydrolase 19-like n=1 Tax=Diadema antillarum TaxID=105358 RepID=UPI003A8C6489